MNTTTRTGLLPAVLTAVCALYSPVLPAQSQSTHQPPRTKWAQTPKAKVKPGPAAIKSLKTAAKAGRAPASHERVAGGAGAKDAASQAARAEAPQVETALPPHQGLATAISLYKAHPDATSWQPVWKELHDMLSNGQAAHASVGVLLHANPSLTEVSVKVDDAGGGARVWSFPNVPEAQGVLLQWQQSVGAPTKSVVGHGRHKTVVFTPAPTVTKLQLIGLPATVVFRDSQIVHSAGVPTVKGKPGHPEVRALVIIGNERGSSTIWLTAYKPSDGVWVENQAVLSSIPPYLVQNVSGKASFSGSDLVFSLGNGTGEAEAGGSSSAPSGYKIVLKFVDGKFLLSGKGNDEGPMLVVQQFMQSVQHGQLDVAKAWLVDPKLLSIAKYAGLMNRPPDKPFKVIAMSAPLLAGERFRLVTFDKTDLIVDVAKVKQQWAIKALFIAPPDPVAQKLLGTVPGPEPVLEKANSAK